MRFSNKNYGIIMRIPADTFLLQFQEEINEIQNARLDSLACSVWYFGGPGTRPRCWGNPEAFYVQR
jgi:hypothetical protein